MGSNRLLLSSLLWINALTSIHGLIPRVCKDNLTQPVAVCCPPPFEGAQACGGPERGVCVEFQVHNQHPEKSLNRLQMTDDRIHWPKRLFQYGCHCNGNFWGFACHECWYGWTGENCEKRHISIRRNVMTYTAEEKRLFQEVTLKSHHVPSNEYVIFRERDGRDSDPLQKPQFMDVSLHQVMVFIHRYTSRSTMFNRRQECSEFLPHFDFNHGGVGFVTWHRFFMLFWERQVAKMAKKYFGIEDFRFPYWDWTDAKSCEVCTVDLVGDLSTFDDPHNMSPFRHWVEYCGESGMVNCNACHTRMLFMNTWPPLMRGWKPKFHFPTSSQVEFTLSRKFYYVKKKNKNCESFTHAIEGTCKAMNETSQFVMHNGVHNAVKGPFSGAAGSTNDPLFPLHHLQIDRVLSAWFRRHQPHIRTMPNRGMKFGHCRDCNLPGIYPPVTHYMMLVDTRALGYDYDSMKFGQNPETDVFD